jgi:hypothetical protein
VARFAKAGADCSGFCRGFLVLTAFLRLLFRDDEANGPLGRFRRGHEFAEGVEDLLELSAGVAAEGVVLPGAGLGLFFEFVQSFG